MPAGTVCLHARKRVTEDSSSDCKTVEYGCIEMEQKKEEGTDEARKMETANQNNLL